MLDKNMEFTGFVEALGSNGEGIVKSEGTTFFMANSFSASFRISAIHERRALI